MKVLTAISFSLLFSTHISASPQDRQSLEELVKDAVSSILFIPSEEGGKSIKINKKGELEGVEEKTITDLIRNELADSLSQFNVDGSEKTN